jgi:hypothetical protein
VSELPIPSEKRLGQNYDMHQRAAYRESLIEKYGENNRDLMELELCHHREALLDDSCAKSFYELLAKPAGQPVSGSRIATWLQLAIDRARIHLPDKFIDSERNLFTLPYMTRSGNLGQIKLSPNYIYDYQTEQGKGQVTMTGLVLNESQRLVPHIDLPINVLSMRMINSTLDLNIPESPTPVEQGQDMLLVKPFSVQSDRLANIMKRLDTALYFWDQD